MGLHEVAVKLGLSYTSYNEAEFKLASFIAKKFKQDLKRELGEEVISIVFYGSRARGVAKNDSDMDILGLMKERPSQGSIISKKINDLVYKNVDKENIYISAIPYAVDDFNQQKKYSPVLYWADKDGIKL